MCIRKNIGSLCVKLMILLLVGCIDPYSPAAIEQNINALIVEGFLNATTKTLTITLTRTLPIYSEGPYKKEEGATIFLEGENEPLQQIDEIEPGVYTRTNLNLNLSKKYRLQIATQDEEYRSEYVTLKQSPVLDGVTWDGIDEGVQVYVDAHDPSNKTRYYQWKLTETWHYTANYFSNIKAEDDTILFKTADELTYVCYKTMESNEILVESTTRLSEDIVNKFPVLLIPKGSTKLAYRYSVLIQQRAIDETAYNYLLQLKKTTETMGGLFDPLPSQLSGNFYNVNNPSDVVIGYFTGGTVREKRIFINYSQLPTHLRKIDYSPYFCDIDTVSKLSIYSLYPYYQIIEGYPSADLDPHQFNQFLVTTQFCTDCRLKDKGTLTRPDFW